MPLDPILDNADLDDLDALTVALGDPRPHPTQAALEQLGEALMCELLDQVLGSALEDNVTLVGEALIGGLHSAAQRLEREADRARDRLALGLRDFDGSEVADHDLQAARSAADRATAAMRCMEVVRDAAAASYGVATGGCWSPWRGSVAGRGITAAQVDAAAALAARRALALQAQDPGASVVVFRGAPGADTAQDARRIFDALNWARSEWPQMSLAVSGAAGADRIAKRWAQQKGVRLVLARADFERHGRAAPFRANADLMALEPVCVLVLARSLDAVRREAERPFGPALNLADLAQSKAVRCVRIRSADT